MDVREYVSWVLNKRHEWGQALFFPDLVSGRAQPRAPFSASPQTPHVIWSSSRRAEVSVDTTLHCPSAWFRSVFIWVPSEANPEMRIRGQCLVWCQEAQEVGWSERGRREEAARRVCYQVHYHCGHLGTWGKTCIGVCPFEGQRVGLFIQKLQFSVN